MIYLSLTIILGLLIVISLGMLFACISVILEENSEGTKITLTSQHTPLFKVISGSLILLIVSTSLFIVTSGQL